MLEIVLAPREMYNRELNEFFTQPGETLRLEHSLVSISKWESKWEIPFISTDKKTKEQMVDYIRCMIETEYFIEFPYPITDRFTQEDFDKVSEYISKKMTATWFSEKPSVTTSTINSNSITSELLYFWMTNFGISWEAENWHVNRLITLIRVCSEMNKEPEKRADQDIIADRQRLNEERRRQYGTKG